MKYQMKLAQLQRNITTKWLLETVLWRIKELVPSYQEYNSIQTFVVPVLDAIVKYNKGIYYD